MRKVLLVLLSVVGLLLVAPTPAQASYVDAGYTYPVSWARALGTTSDTAFSIDATHAAHCFSQRYDQTSTAGHRVRIDSEGCLVYNTNHDYFQAVSVFYMLDAGGFDGCATSCNNVYTLDSCSLNSTTACSGFTKGVFKQETHCSWSALTTMGGTKGYGCFGPTYHITASKFTQARTQFDIDCYGVVQGFDVGFPQDCPDDFNTVTVTLD